MRFVLCGLLLAWLAGCHDDDARLWRYRLEYRLFDTQGRTQVWVALPSSIPNRQTIESRVYSLRPLRFKTQNNDSAAQFQLFGHQDTARLFMEGVVRLDALPSLRPIDSTRFDSLEFWASSQLAYRQHPAEDSYETALRQGFGDCSEFTEVMLHACDNARLDSRRIEGISGPDSGQLAHAWAECGRDSTWTRLDATRRKTAPFRPDRDGYLQIPNLKNWPEFQGLRWVAAHTEKRGLAVELYARLVPCQIDFWGECK